jgi:hypothetical protein
VIVIRGHLGFGDCIHQRAIVRDLMDRGEDVVLETFYSALYQDFRERGLKLQPIQGHPPRVREENKLVRDPVVIPEDTRRYKLSYNADAIRKHGSILAAQYACCGMRIPALPDFSIPVPDAYWQSALAKISRLGVANDKPLMVYRPLVLNNLFHCESRLPDVDAYAALYKSIRDQYHVVSVANLGDYGEHIVGPEMDADVKFHHGELSYEELVGLYAEADLAFTCAGFAPVLAQAVGTRTVVVYGGHEGFRTTNSVGEHLAPTLAIEPFNVCECHGGHYTRGQNQELVKPSKTHECDKTIDMEAAMRRLQNWEEWHYAHA